MAGAVALVAPSFAEGFGLPIVESLAAGTPALASDIAAHREVGGDLVLYADPVDGPSWLSAIQTLMDPRAQLSAEMRAKIAGYQPMTWKAHVEDAMESLMRPAVAVRDEEAPIDPEAGAATPNGRGAEPKRTWRQTQIHANFFQCTPLPFSAFSRA